MSLSQVLDMLDTLSDDELAQVEHRIQQRRHDKSDMPDLSAFVGLSDDQLWAVVNTPFDVVQDERLQYLHEQRETRQLTDKEEQEVDDLLESYDKFIVMRSKAMLVLQQRGIDVMRELSRR